MFYGEKTATSNNKPTATARGAGRQENPGASASSNALTLPLVSSYEPPCMWPVSVSGAAYLLSTPMLITPLSRLGHRAGRAGSFPRISAGTVSRDLTQGALHAGMPEGDGHVYRTRPPQWAGVGLLLLRVCCCCSCSGPPSQITGGPQTLISLSRTHSFAMVHASLIRPG